MAIIVDKEQKRRDIALASKALILEKGIMEPTISAIAKAAGIGKGTFYEYFKSKEALLFELVNILMYEYNASQESKLSTCYSTQEKLKCFAGFFYEEESRELRLLYKMFVGMSMISVHEEVVAFQTECFDYYYHWFERLIQEGIDQGEIVPETRQMAKGLFAMAKGMFIASETTHSIEDLEKEIAVYVDTLFIFVAKEENNAS